MAVSVDTVYQRVLTLANKEQRGYITPQEFNLLANQVQMETFEQYFYDIKQLSRMPGNTEEYSDPLSVLYKKISIFEVEKNQAWVNTNMPITYVGGGGVRPIPSEVYKVGVIQNKNPARLVEILSSKDFDEAMMLPLTSGSTERPIAKITSEGIWISPLKHVNLFRFIKKPNKVEWAYVIVNDKPLYNANISVNFELHPSEETELVYKILKLAGINMKSEDIMAQGQALEQYQLSLEKQ